MPAVDRRTFLRMSLGGAAALVVMSCSKGGDSDDGDAGGPGRRPTLRLASSPVDFGLPSPFAYGAAPGYQLMILMYDTLLQEDPDGRMLPLLARAFRRSDDGLTWTFELREGVTWHDGRPLTADDVVFSYEYHQAHSDSPELVARPTDVAEVRSTGPGTVEIRLVRPIVTFAANVAGQLPIVPRHVWSSIEDPAERDDQALLVGSGPYRLETYEAGQGAYLFTANDGYFLGKPFVKRIEQRQQAEELTALVAGEIDLANTNPYGVPSDTLTEFRSNDEFGIQEYKNNLAVPLRWNLSKGGALADPRFRQACARAINREDIVRRLTSGNAAVGSAGYLPPDNPFKVAVDEYPFDKAAAERLLDDAGYTRSASGARTQPGGRPLRYTLTVIEDVPSVLELVTRDLNSVGVAVTPRKVPLITLLGSADYDMAIGFDGDISADSDPDHLRLVFSSTSTAFQHPPGYDNPEVDELVERQAVTVDAAERKALIGDIQRLVAKDLPVLPLYYPNGYSIFRKATFDQWSEGHALTETKRNLMTGRRSGLEIRPGS